MSAVPPAGKGTTMRICLLGYDAASCAIAGKPTRRLMQQPNNKVIRIADCMKNSSGVRGDYNFTVRETSTYSEYESIS
jgi:hypothetical protein